jgi:hypothetical protein
MLEPWEWDQFKVTLLERAIAFLGVLSIDCSGFVQKQLANADARSGLRPATRFATATLWQRFRTLL